MIENSSVYDVANVSPITNATNLSNKLGHNVFLKRELQPIFSFKNRGAYNKIVNIKKDKLKLGVIAASAGNHAQGVASACKKLKIKCLIVMPKTTPEIKIRAVKNFGARVKLHGDNYDQAVKHAYEICKKEKKEFIHPFDDPYTPVGGGGLLAGVSAWIAQNNKKIKIYGVEVDDSACLYEALKANKRVRLKSVGIFADGVAVEQVGKNNFDVIKECIDGVITVTIDEVCAAVKDLFEDTRVMSEPAGAVA